MSRDISGMFQRLSDIYASPPLQRLLADEHAMLWPQLQRCVGRHGLFITAVRQDKPLALPLLNHWTHLILRDGYYHGDLYARSDEPLPFVDEGFELVILRHALEVSAMPAQLLEEAGRILVPGGLLVLTGLHPLSAWLPWLLWYGGARLVLDSRLSLRAWLRGAEWEIEQSCRVGPLWPHQHSMQPIQRLLGGGYVLQIRKQSKALTYLPNRDLPVRMPIRVSLAPGAHQEGTSLSVPTIGKVHHDDRYEAN